MLRLAWICLLLGGCDQLFKITHVEPSQPDAYVADSAIDAPMECVGRGLLVACIDPAVGDTLTVSGAVDTDTDSRCIALKQPGDLELCAFAATHITVTAAVVTGARPLVLVALDRVDVQGTLDLSSRTAGVARQGAGARSQCTTSTGGDGTTGAGGGAGGSFGFVGGAGASGQAGAAAGAQAGPALAPMAVHGGCPGTPGGIAGSELRVAPGAGGGAVHVIAVNEIAIGGGGIINVSGAGGNGGGVKSGGAGGGAGGYVGLDAPSVRIAGQVFSRGGGGGGGGGAATTGVDGADAPVFAGAVSGGPGGASGGTSGGDGADGGVGGIPGGTATNGGGAGGGACGFIYIWGTPAITGLLKPPALTP